MCLFFLFLCVVRSASNCHTATDSRSLGCFDVSRQSHFQHACSFFFENLASSSSVPSRFLPSLERQVFRNVTYIVLMSYSSNISVGALHKVIILICCPHSSHSGIMAFVTTSVLSYALDQHWPGAVSGGLQSYALALVSSYLRLSRYIRTCPAVTESRLPLMTQIPIIGNRMEFDHMLNNCTN